MRNLFLFLIFGILGFTIQAQINYQSGYFIDNLGNRTECLIKNEDWLYNPNQIECKLTKEDNNTIKTLNTIQEFGFLNGVTYLKTKVKINRSTDQLESLEKTSKIEFSEEELLLKVLIKGKVSLYHYTEFNFERFFFKNKDGNIEQLVYKRYTNEYKNLLENEAFKQQLWTSLKSDCISKRDIERLEYDKKNLQKLFEKYIYCGVQTQKKVKKKSSIKNWNLFLNSGYSFKKIDGFNVSSADIPLDFDSRVGFTFGMELERILNFNKNKWGIFVAPSYEQINGDYQNQDNIVFARTASLDIKMIQIPIGIRHYFYFDNTDDIAFFAELSRILSFGIGDGVQYRPGLDLPQKSFNSNFGLAAGFKYKKYRIFFRFHLEKSILEDESVDVKDKGLSMFFGYQLF